MPETPAIVSDLFRFVPHPRITERQAEGVPKVTDHLPAETAYQRFNKTLAIKITDAVGSMTCAYIFSLLALCSLPAVLSQFHVFHSTFPNWLVKASVIALVSWIAQTYIQLVLLSVIIVGQNIQSASSDQRAEQTYKDAEAVLQTALQIQEHLAAQDAQLVQIIGCIEPSSSTPAPTTTVETDSTTDRAKE